ncbi:MAG: 30S ribosomal protein S16 [Bdellovibrionales bacterium CG12_big_fil_rev_8_21_14_0_65_38_15]|nr:MAG: 30S ribosomal protein S16 [Bdellovibrionales bacterium CG22_combo_CG10-13_8_21_14_all_38_13]PIQ55692.1 MAG: 30S ribosomal protein S16 [Bdellovibrionales bacterium CG12_big_fil_rev_8_21_14_0_65_38_15]PIR30702.1 MAG: 30S ribosomal protein S16 [Bdellovibrionales bacterium CG11_big_fil_rev_8_21_14_0_20_38_13]
MVTIRLARGGRTHQPLYTIVATDSRSARNGRFLERMGNYDPSQEEGKTLTNVNADSIAAWVKKGATMSDTVKTLLKRNKIALK